MQLFNKIWSKFRISNCLYFNAFHIELFLKKIMKFINTFFKELGLLLEKINKSSFTVTYIENNGYLRITFVNSCYSLSSVKILHRNSIQIFKILVSHNTTSQESNFAYSQIQKSFKLYYFFLLKNIFAFKPQDWDKPQN